MSSAIANIAAFGQGATQGLGQGMDIYAKYKQMEDEGAVRNKKKAIDQEVQQLTQNGAFEKDPIAGMGQVADIYAKHGLMDDWAKYNQAATGLKKAKTDQLGMQVFQAAGVDPVGAVPMLNKFAEATGSGDKFELQPQMGGGFTLVSTIGGKAHPASYSTPQELEHAINQYIEPYLMGDVGKFKLNETEVGKNQAQMARDTQATASDAALLGPRVEAEKAQAASGYASADNSRASAASERALAPLRVDQARASIDASKANTAQSQAAIDEAAALFPTKKAGMEATTAYNQGLAAQIGKPQPESISAVADRLMKDPTPDLDGNMPENPALYKQNVATLGELINQGQGGGMTGADGFAAGQILANKLGKYTQDEVRAEANGTIHFPDGTTAKIDPNGISELPRYAKPDAKGP